MKLLTKAIERALPKLGSTANDNDPMVQCKFFLSGTSKTWFVTEFDGRNTFFAYAIDFEEGLCYLLKSELEAARNAYGVGIERDMYFSPKPLSEALAEFDSISGR